MRTLKKLLFIPLLMATALLSACNEKEFSDGYQFGDLTRFTGRELQELEGARQDYCADNADSLIRKTALAFLQLKLPGLPANGICNPLFDAFTQAQTVRANNPETAIDAKARESPDHAP